MTAKTQKLNKTINILNKFIFKLAILLMIAFIFFCYVSSVDVDQSTPAQMKIYRLLSVLLGIAGFLSLGCALFVRIYYNKNIRENLTAAKKRKHIYLFDILNYAFMIFFMILCIYPIIFVIAGSFNVGSDYSLGGVYFFPRKFTFENYKVVVENKGLWTGYAITLARTVVGTLTALLFTAAVAYAMSRKNLRFRKVFHWINLFTMFFGGGLIPYFLIIKTLGLINNFLVYIIPGLYSVYNMIILSTFFGGISEEMHESALLDGASEVRIFAQIYLPLSKPVLATVALWVAIGHWNSFFDCMIYTSNAPELQTLQYFLLKAIQTSTMTEGMPPEQMTRLSPKTIALAAIILSIIPVLFLFPAIQKNFNSGIMIGSLKG